jgi:hypothetical protein
MKRIQLSVLAAMLAAVSSQGALANGAVAIGTSGSVARNGVAIGMSTQFPSVAAASKDALSQCRHGADAKASSRAACRIVKTFSGQCAAIALDPQPGTSGYGWAIASFEWQAKSAAVANCNKVAGPGRQGACKAVGSDCD